MKEVLKVRKFDKLARKYIKILHLKHEPEQCFYDELVHFILMWDKKQYRCRLLEKDTEKDDLIEKYNFCNGNCDGCEYKK